MGPVGAIGAPTKAERGEANMRAKAIRDLCQLQDDSFFKELAEGLAHILRNVAEITTDADALAENDRPRGMCILRAAGREEAAKALILLDAVRCPRRSREDKERFTRQLTCFDKHLAKGIYTEYCGSRFAAFNEVRRWVENERQELYLDGPLGVDWIFRNAILQKREQTIYVDYVESDGERFWLTPFRYDEAAREWPDIGAGAAVLLALALGRTGMTEAQALKVVSDIWRPIQMTDDFSWQQLRKLNVRTLEELNQTGLLKENQQDAYRVVVNEWLFPLSSLDLSVVKVKRSELDEIRESWTPDL